MTTSINLDGVRQWRRYTDLKSTGFSWIGDVPSHWQVKRLKHVCQMNPSKTEIRELADDVAVSFLPMEKVHEQGGLDLDLRRPLGVLRQGFTYFRDGDVLVAKITPCFENGKGALASGLENGIGFGTTELHVLRPLPVVDPRFLELVTRQYSFRRLGCTSMTGVAGQQRVSEAFISNFVFGLPPLDEQCRIAAFLDRETAKIDAMIAKKERLVELLHEKRTAVISHAVTKGLDPTVLMKDSGVDWLGQIPAHWDAVRLARFVGNIEQGWSPQADDRRAVEDEWAVTKLGAVFKGRFRSAEHKALPADLQPETRYEVRDGDFLLTRANTPELVGDVCVVRKPRRKLMLCDLIYRVQVDERTVLKQFLALALLSRLGRYQITREARGSSQSMVKLSQGHVRSLVIARPDLEEQGRIIKVVEGETSKLDSLIAKVRDGIEKLQEYRNALVTAAVTGKIDVSSEAVAEVEPKPVPQKPAAKPNPYFRRTVFAAEIIDRLCDEPTFGHVKFQKCLFVAQHHLGVGDFEESYKRMAAGPYDNRLVRSVDSQLEKSRWFKAEKSGDRYAYRRLDKAGGHRKYFDSYFGDHADQLAKLLDLFRPLDTDRAEIVATLYAVWNDFLIRGEAFDDDKIVAEVLTNWHDRKKRFDDAIWRRALNWMRDKGLVPTGFGTPTVPGDGKEA